jgi:hypothetical protein
LPFPGATPKTWTQILTEYPNARILPGDSFLGIRVGEPYPTGYTENIDAFKFGTAGGTLVFDFDPSACTGGGGHGDGGMNGKQGGEAHSHFHKRGCGSADPAEEDDNVRHRDAGAGTDFQSTSITSSASTADAGSRTMTLVGTGTNNGLPVAFTATAVDNGALVPGVFTIVLSDGYTLTGALTSGAITVR